MDVSGKEVAYQAGKIVIIVWDPHKDFEVRGQYGGREDEYEIKCPGIKINGKMAHQPHNARYTSNNVKLTQHTICYSCTLLGKEAARKPLNPAQEKRKTRGDQLVLQLQKQEAKA